MVLEWQKNREFQFSQRSSAHGVGYLFEPNQSRLHYIYWFVVCSACLAACVHLCHESIVSSYEDPVLTTIDSLTWPLEKVPVRVGCIGCILKDYLTTNVLSYFDLNPPCI